MNDEEKKEFAKWQRELVDKIDEKIRIRMGILSRNTRLRQKMERDIKKSLDK